MPKHLLTWISYSIILVAAGFWFYGALSSDYSYVFLLTDLLVYFLLIIVVGFGFYARSKEHLMRPWTRVFNRKIAMISLVFLLTYVVFGLLDSVHFKRALKDDVAQNTGKTTQSKIQYSPEVISALDLILHHMKSNREKTYSAPFATQLFSKESIQTDHGTIRAYPRLKYGGAHLKDPDKEKSGDILWLTTKALMQTILFVILMLTLLVLDMSRHWSAPRKATLITIIKGQTEVPWREMTIALGLIAFVVFLIANISPYYHMMGTDKVGNDVLYLSLKSIRTGLVIGTLTTLVMLPFAIALGIMAGYFRSWVDDVIQFSYTTLSSIPGVLLIAACILSLDLFVQNHPDWFESSLERADMRLFILCVVLGITSWTGLCRILRGEAMKLAELDYVNAAQAFGVRQSKILMQHILPNVMHLVLISVVLDFSSLVLAEAVLSYVGVGVDPTTVSWGNMINSARLEMAREPVVWWSLVAAFIFMFALVLSANLFSDAVRDAFDPRLARARS